MRVNHEANRILEQKLLESRERLFAGKNVALTKALLNLFPNLSNAFLVDHQPDQDVDIFWILVSLDLIAIIEIPRDEYMETMDVVTEIIKVKDYSRQKLDKDSRRWLDMAIRLLKLDGVPYLSPYINHDGAEE